MNIDIKTILVIGISLVNVIIICTVKFNDLKHLTEDVKELREGFNHYVKKLYSLAQRISKIEGKMNGQKR